MLTLITKFTVHAGCEEEFERVMRMAVPKVREEPGNHAYILHRSTDDPRVLMCYEAYESEEALSAHHAHLKDMGIDWRALLDSEPTLEFYDKLL